MRKLIWYASAYWRKHGRLVIISSVVAVLFFSLVLPAILDRVTTKPRRYIGLVGGYSIQNLPPEISQLISMGLTQVEPDGTVSPGIARRWSIEDEGQTYRFIIRDDLIWHDGKPVEPQDIQYVFDDVETITTQNDVVYKLPDTFVPFPTTVSQPLIREETNLRYRFWPQTSYYGVGLFRVAKADVQNNGQLNELVLDGPNERRIYRFYLTEQEARTAFKHGLIDELQDLTEPGEIATWPSITSTATLQKNRYLAVFFNTQSPLFLKNIRQALSYATPKPSNNKRALGPISPDSWVYLPSIKEYEFSYERALERLLAELPPQPLSFTLSTTPIFADQAEEIKRSWEELGDVAVPACQDDSDVTDTSQCANLDIQVELLISPFPDTKDFQALLIGQEAPADPDQYSLWHSDQPTNFTRYQNTRIDSLLEQGRQVADREERRAIYQEFQQFLLEDAPAVFIHYLETYTIARD